jgi:hypothetical protein
MLDRTMVPLVNNTSISTSYYPIKVDLKSYSMLFQESLNPAPLPTNLEGRLTPLESP